MALVRAIVMLGLLVAGTTLAAGCRAGDRDRTALRDRDYEQPRSMVFPSEAQRQLADAGATDTLPWYSARQDARLGVTVGVRSRTYERVVTRTNDRQYIFDGRPSDHFRESTHRIETKEAVH